MPQYRYGLYDTALFTTAASADFPLFQSAQGSTATRTKEITNSRGAGQLPQNESFKCDRICVFYDENMVLADVINMWVDSYIEIRVNDETVLLVPMRVAASYNAFGGHYSEVTATAEAAIGLAGEGYMLDIPIEIPGGVAFTVTLHQGAALATATQEVKCFLDGILTRS